MSPTQVHNRLLATNKPNKIGLVQVVLVGCTDFSKLEKLSPDEKRTIEVSVFRSAQSGGPNPIKVIVGSKSPESQRFTLFYSVMPIFYN